MPYTSSALRLETDEHACIHHHLPTSPSPHSDKRRKGLDLGFSDTEALAKPRRALRKALNLLSPLARKVAESDPYMPADAV